MKVLRLHRHGPPPLFIHEDAPTPVAGPGEVLIRVHAAAVTPTELVWAPTSTSRDGEPRPLPLVMGHEYAGEVAALGAGVDDLAVGEAVYGMNDWYRDGAQAEYCVARAGELARKPRLVDDDAAAAVPISALTAWQGLVEHGRLAPGERALIHGGAGGVGIFAVQLARALGAEVAATASAHNLDFVRSLGAALVIDHRAERFESAVRDVDLVLDTVGGETLERSFGVLRAGGRVVAIAASEEAATSQRVRDAFFIVEPSRPQLEEIARRIDAGTLRVVVGAVFPLTRGQEAYAHKPERGKVVLRVNAPAKN